MFNPAIWGKEYTVYHSLVSQANTKLFQVNPTLAAGDVKISKDGGAEANLATLPVVAPSGSRNVKLIVSAVEMQADNVKINYVDAAGAEWCDREIIIQPTKLLTFGTVDDAAFAPTTTQFETSSITESTADHFRNRLILFLTGALTGQIARITNYSLNTGRGRFTVTGVTGSAMSEAPANGDAFGLL